MELLNEWAPDLKNKFIISKRVGNNEENLKVISEKLGFKYSTLTNPLGGLFPLLTEREKELDVCISFLRNSLFSKPVNSPKGYESYPIKHFNIESVFDIENKYNKYHFSKKGHEFLLKNKSNEWEWLFHGSNSKEASFNIAISNFSVRRLGESSGNQGCYGEGIYFSPRGYDPMFHCAIVNNHFMILACKVMKGTYQVIKELSKEEVTKGIPIPEKFDSNISANSLEIAVRNSDQILPSFLIKFSVSGLKKSGTIIWKTPKGNKELPQIYCNGLKLRSFV